MSTDTLTLTWPQVEKLIDALAKQIESKLPVGDLSIIPLGRGGLVPAGLLAYRLRTKKIGSFMFVRNPEPVRPYIPLFVDDITDTGRTLREHRRDYAISYTTYPFYASIVQRLSCPRTDRAHFSSLQYPGEEWIIFPWAPNDDIQDRRHEVYERDEMGPDSSGGRDSGDGSVRDGTEEVREGQLETGDPIQQCSESSGEPPQSVEDSTPHETKPGEGPSA